MLGIIEANQSSKDFRGRSEQLYLHKKSWYVQLVILKKNAMNDLALCDDTKLYTK